MKDYIGRLVEKFESGNNRCRSFSQCGPDYGLSCGTNQRILRFGVSINFLKKYFPDEECVQKLYWNNLQDRALNYYPGESYCSSPEAVQAAWLYCVNKVGDEQFEQYEYEDILENYYNPCCELLKDVMDVDNTNRAYQESVFAGAILYGANSYAKLIKDIIQINKINVATQQDVLFELIYDKRFFDYPWNRHNKAENMKVSSNESEREILRPYLTVKPLRKENKNMKELCLVIDPGHYPKYNPGINLSVCEGDVMFELAQAEKEYCDKYYKDNIDCFLTRDYKTDVALYDRGMQAVNKKLTGKYKKVMFMSDHTNAPKENDPNVTGICVFTSQFRSNTYNFLDRFAVHIGSVMGSHYLYRDAQAWKNLEPQHNTTADYWGVIRGSMAGATNEVESWSKGVDITCIIEHGFHTNRYECEWFASSENIQKMAKAKIDFIAKEFGIQKKENSIMKGFWLCDGTVSFNCAVNAYSEPKLSSSISGILEKGSKYRAVQGIQMSDNTDWYRLETGAYVQNSPNISYMNNKAKRFVVAVNSPDGTLNVRDFPNSNIGNIKKTLRNGNLIEVCGEAYNNNDHWYWIDQGNASEKFSGFVAAKYVK